MLLSPATFTSAHLPSGNIIAPSSKRRCIKPVLSASRALHTITSMTPTNTLPMIFGAPLELPLSPPMEGTASLPRKKAMGMRPGNKDQASGGNRRKTSTVTKTVVEAEESNTKKSEEKKKKPRALFATPEQTSLPSEVPRGLTRTLFAQAFDVSRPRGCSDQDDQDLIALVANSLASTVAAQQPQPCSYTTTTPPSSSRKRRRED